MSSEWCQIWFTKWYDNDKRPPSVLTIWQEIQRSWHTSYFGLWMVIILCFMLIMDPGKIRSLFLKVDNYLHTIWLVQFWIAKYLHYIELNSKYYLRNSKKGPIIHPKWPFVVFEGYSSKSTQRAKQYSNGLYKWPKKRLYHFQKVLLTDCLLLLINAFYTLYFSYTVLTQLVP